MLGTNTKDKTNRSINSDCCYLWNKRTPLPGYPSNSSYVIRQYKDLSYPVTESHDRLMLLKDVEVAVNFDDIAKIKC